MITRPPGETPPTSPTSSRIDLDDVHDSLITPECEGSLHISEFGKYTEEYKNAVEAFFKMYVKSLPLL